VAKSQERKMIRLSPFGELGLDTSLQDLGFLLQRFPEVLRSRG
jgi:hypothetical protein